MSADQPGATDDLRDELPEDLNAVDHVIAYRFPDNSRRRIPGVIYLGAAAVCVALYLITRPGATLVNRGMVWAAVILALLGVFSITSGWRMHVDEKQALVAAQGALGFPVGHASAQQVWRGLRSRPTWRVLAYSSENPPRQRALVLVDAVDGRVLEHIVEHNPEDDWSE
ncbi:MAG: hypothetical protein V9E89_11800 [Ilumatobacteraceae bacterium]